MMSLSAGEYEMPRVGVVDLLFGTGEIVEYFSEQWELGEVKVEFSVLILCIVFKLLLLLLFTFWSVEDGILGVVAIDDTAE